MTLQALAAWGQALAVRPSLVAAVVEWVVRPGPPESRVAQQARPSGVVQAPQPAEGPRPLAGLQSAPTLQPAPWHAHPWRPLRRQARPQPQTNARSQRRESRRSPCLRQAQAQLREPPPKQVEAPLRGQ